MKKDVRLGILAGIALAGLFCFSACHQHSSKQAMSPATKILFLHHSTGKVILRAGESKILDKLGVPVGVPRMIARYNREHQTNYVFSEQYFPKEVPYGWKNYPYDYYNIWIKNAGNEPFMEEPTLEMLTREYNVIVFKHCFPVSRIEPGTEPDSLDPEKKTIGNYKQQYAELKTKLRQFPQTRFLIWTGAANVESKTTPEQAAAAREFFSWVIREWDEPGDNIFIWDFWSLETEGGLYLPEKNAQAQNNSHPGTAFAKKAAPLFVNRMVDVIEGRGDSGSVTGMK